jgi:hypothetical protein
VIGNADEHPSVQDALQLFPASFRGFGIRPDARNRRNIAIERPVILDDFVAGLTHGSIISRRIDLQPAYGVPSTAIV